MSHNIELFDYPQKGDKNAVKSKLDSHVAMADHGEGACGLPCPIEWIDKTFDSRDEAEDFVSNYGSHDYKQVAVKYKSYEGCHVIPSKKYLSLKKREEELEAKYKEKSRKLHYADVKSDYISCKTCGSKLSTAYLHSNSCPLCYSDLRPVSTLSSIEAAKKAYKKAKTEAENEWKKLEARFRKDKYEIRWFLKIEYHT